MAPLFMKGKVMKFTNPYWSYKLRIEVLQRWILIHSILYYEMNESIVSDKEFDDHAKQLVEMQNNYPDSAKASQYWNAFHDFDGTTGFDLPHRLSDTDKQHLFKIAHHVLNVYKGGQRSERR